MAFSEASGTFVRPRHWLSLFVHVTWRTGRGKTPKPSSGGSGIADRLLPRLVHLERGLYGIVGIKSGTGTWVCMPQTKPRWYVLNYNVYDMYIDAYSDGWSYFVYDECLANVPFKGLKSQPPGEFVCCRALTKITHLEDSDFTYP